MRFRLIAAAAVALATGCAPAISYLDPAGPRFAGSYAGRATPRSLRIVTFNIRRFDPEVDSEPHWVDYDVELYSRTASWTRCTRSSGRSTGR